MKLIDAQELTNNKLFALRIANITQTNNIESKCRWHIFHVR